jgi:hypothetical protein
MKRAIAEYLKLGTEGPYFYRMVETVLSRDKNWVRWKIENCPSIELPPVSPDEFAEAKRIIQRITTNKRLRPTPMGSLSLSFLEDDPKRGLEKLQDPQRYQLPELSSFRRKIADEDLEIDFPTNNQTKQAAISRKASLSWRALRIASRTRLARFDKIEDPNSIEAIFDVEKRPDDEEVAEVEVEEQDETLETVETVEAAEVVVKTEGAETTADQGKDESTEKISQDNANMGESLKDMVAESTAPGEVEDTNVMAPTSDGDAVMVDATNT